MIAGVFGDGKNFDYDDIESEMSYFFFDEICVLSGGDMESFMHRFAKKNGVKLTIFFSNQEHQMPYAVEEKKSEILSRADHIITFNTKGQENTKTIEKKAEELKKRITKIYKDKRGVWIKSPFSK
jgi:hypothetical protein